MLFLQLQHYNNTSSTLVGRDENTFFNLGQEQVGVYISSSPTVKLLLWLDAFKSLNLSHSQTCASKYADRTQSILLCQSVYA